MSFTFSPKCWIVFFVVTIPFLEGSVQAQTLPFTNHTEVGLLRSNDTFGSRSSFTFQTFNGVKAKDWLSIGFTTGLDAYRQASIIPIALGARGILQNKHKFSPTAGMDIGVGAALFEEDSRTEWTEGGFLFNPFLGLLMKTKGKGLLSLTIGYKRQVITEFRGTLSSLNNRTNSLPPGYDSLNKDKLTFNRASIRLGVFF